MRCTIMSVMFVVLAVVPCATFAASCEVERLLGGHPTSKTLVHAYYQMVADGVDPLFISLEQLTAYASRHGFKLHVGPATSPEHSPYVTVVRDFTNPAIQPPAGTRVVGTGSDWETESVPPVWNGSAWVYAADVTPPQNW